MEKPQAPLRIEFPALFALFALSFGVFYWGSTAIQTAYFDEPHYLDAIRRWVHALGDTNREHPPLGRMIIALFMQFFHDEPLGWRLASVLAGSWSVLSLALIGAKISNNIRGFWMTGILALTSGGLFVFSRIAMLDGIAVCFMLFSAYYFVSSLSGEVDTQVTRHAGFYLGLSLATKWLALPYWGIGAVFFILIAIRERSAMSLWTLVSHWIIYPLFAYTIVYAFWVIKTGGFSFHVLWESLTKLQIQMFQAMNTATGDHPYKSFWWEWPTMARPTWFLFEPVTSATSPNASQMRGILFWVNPLLLFFGVLAGVKLLIDGILKKEATRLFIPLAYLSLWLSWFFSWRQVQFFYYYFPAVTMLIIALGVVLSEIRIRWIAWTGIALSFLLFAYFYPILAGLPIVKESFRQWMWFSSWI